MTVNTLNTERSINDLEINPLGGCIGAEIYGLDASNLSDADLSEVNAALLSHHVLVFRDQTVSAENLYNFARKFGPCRVETAPKKRELSHPEYPDILVLDDRGLSATTAVWHSEAQAYPTPPAFTILGAHILPPSGGDTLFANQHVAFESLSEAMREMLMPLRAVNSVAAAGEPMSSSHPVVRKHPDTGRLALYVSEFFTKHFDGMTVQESSGLLDYLCSYSIKPEFCYRHIWKKGDIIIWDNRSVQHRAVKDYGAHKRSMYHMEVLDQQPL